MSSQSNIPKDKTWFFSGFFSDSYESLKNVWTWLFPEKESYPENESGEFIRRALAAKSWFDTLSSSWVEQPFVQRL